jgi:hypothetical protein
MIVMRRVYVLAYISSLEAYTFFSPRAHGGRLHADSRLMH